MNKININIILLPNLIDPCPFKLECNPEYEVVSPETDAWLCSHGLPYMESTKKYNLWSALTFTRCSRVRLRDACDFCTLLFLADDIMDSVGSAEDSDQSKRQLFQNINECLQPAGQFKPLTPLAAALHEWWQRILINATSACQQRLLAAYQASNEASLLQVTDRKNRQTIPDLETYIEFRRDTSYGRVACIFVEYSLDLNLLDVCWMDKTFKCLVDYATDAAAWTNDIYSFNVEQSKGDYNLISVLLHADKSLSIQQAMDRAGQMVIDRYNDFERVRGELISWGTEIDTQVKKFVDGLATGIIANAVWSFETPRYFGTNRKEVKITRRITLLKCEAEIRENIINSLNKQSAYSNGSTVEKIPSQRNFRQNQPTATTMTFDDVLSFKYMAEITQPMDYLNSLPSKKIRSKLIHGFNYWLQSPEEKLIIIDEIIDKLHNASLLIDDIEDGSVIRRGAPAAHIIYGVPLTINTAELICFQSMKEALKLNHPHVGSILIDHLIDMHKGQGYDIWCRDNYICLSEESYCQMVISKCGGLFHLAIELLRLFSPIKTDIKQNKLIDDLCQTLSLLFQIRDDYCNLMSDEYTRNKSYCEDLTEGKFSFPIIHALHTYPEDTRLSDILKQRTNNIDLKREAVELLHQYGSIEYTRNRCLKLANECYSYMDQLKENLYLKIIINKLMVIFHDPAQNELN